MTESSVEWFDNLLLKGIVTPKFAGKSRWIIRQIPVCVLNYKRFRFLLNISVQSFRTIIKVYFKRIWILAGLRFECGDLRAEICECRDFRDEIWELRFVALKIYAFKCEYCKLDSGLSYLIERIWLWSFIIILNRMMWNIGLKLFG